MDGLVSRDTELVVDFESGGTTSEEDGIVLAKNQGGEVVNTFSSFHCLPNSSKFADENVELLLDKREECQHHVVWVKKELAKEKKNESRKHPSHLGRLKVHHDHKLVHEIAELAMRKRTRAERIRMLKKMRAAKSSSWNGTLWALLVNVIFFIIIIFEVITFLPTF